MASMMDDAAARKLIKQARSAANTAQAPGCQILVDVADRVIHHGDAVGAAFAAGRAYACAEAVRARAAAADFGVSRPRKQRRRRR